MHLFPAILSLGLLAAPAHGDEGAALPEPPPPAASGNFSAAGRNRDHLDHHNAERSSRRGAHMMLMRRLLLDKYDLNGDDLIDGEERRQLLRDAFATKEKALRELIARFDKDGDGKLNAAELDQLHQSVRPAVPMRPAHADTPNGPPPQEFPPFSVPPDAGPLALLTQKLLLETYDADGDGRLSERERNAVDTDADALFAARTKELLARFDQNGDGKLDPGERTYARRLLREERELGKELDAASPHLDPIDIYLDTFYDMAVIHALGNPEK